MIHLKFQLGLTEVLAVAYSDESSGTPVSVGTTTTAEYSSEDLALRKGPNRLLLKMLKPRYDDLQDDATGYVAKTPWYPALRYELRNYYDLGGRDISLSTMNLTIRRLQSGLATDPETATDPRTQADVKLIEVLGLDQRGKAGSSNPDLPDGRVDDQFIDPANGIIFFPDLHPFAPDSSPPDSTVPCGPGYGGFNCLDNFNRNFLAGATANRKVYYTKNPDAFQDTRYYIEAEYKSSQQGFFLGRFDILENSEQVKVDGIPKVRGTDYSIDYQTGQLTFISPPKPDQTITVDFSFSPGFGTTQLTLLGASASYVPGPNLSVTSSVLFDSRGAQEKNPKLGEEPAKSIIGDLSSVVTFKPVWMTALANDYSYEDVFASQLKNYGKPGDVALGLSVSGNSPNCVKALEWAKLNGLKTVALVGAKRGRMAEVAEQVLVINNTHYGRVEDAQMGICHMLCYAFMENPGLGKL